MVQKYVWNDDKKLLDLKRVEFRTSAVMYDLLGEVATEHGVSRSAMLNAMLLHLFDPKRRHLFTVEVGPTHVHIREVSRIN